ncbi:MAG: bifunctional 3-(3-hydroxy-phenyl)propionate/3-hydroxycinnamic acid hydroxylase [Chloroflexi bacterium]|nr:bifunctional 3-(3-hydroxy-phenyl)propionate/3-hydroxycinnamic acid hydroxylase [Chloroflexota bacterium]
MYDADVLVVGAGPTGLTLANVLGQAGVSTLVVERNASTTDEPKAVSIDEESLRLLQSIGLYESMLTLLLPGTGTRYYGVGGALLGAARGPYPPRYGHPIKSELDQPEFEHALADGAVRFGSVSLRFSTELLDVSQDEDCVVASVQPLHGDPESVRARYVVGCDGGRSSVRKLMRVRMCGSSLQEPWVVLDTRNDPHDVRYAMHHGDPHRPHVIIPGRDGRCRYEFLLLPGERADDMLSLEQLQRLTAPYRRLAAGDIVRAKVYTFHALVAEHWRQGRVFVAGDAAHMMPPFAGQGLNTGLRDAHNLGWKLASVARGTAGPRLLETYEAERRAHAEAMIAMSVKLGNIVMTRSRARALARDAFFRSLGQWGPIRRYISEMRYKPPPRYRQGLLVGSDASIAGTMLPQPQVVMLDGRVHLLDDALGSGWAVLALADGTKDPFVGLEHSVWRLLDPSFIRVYSSERWPARTAPCRTPVVDDQAVLVSELWPSGPRFVLVRPDRYIAGAFTLAESHAVAEQLSAFLDLDQAHTEDVLDALAVTIH